MMNTQTLKLARQRGDHHTPSHSSKHPYIHILLSHPALRVSAQIQNASLRKPEFLIQVLASNQQTPGGPVPTFTNCDLGMG